jgi:hypothetical protein
LRVALKAGASTKYIEWEYDSAAKTITRADLASATVTATATDKKKKLTGIIMPAGSTLFRYYCRQGAELDPSSLTATDIASMTGRVNVTIQAAVMTRGAPFLESEAVDLRNQEVVAC